MNKNGGDRLEHEFGANSSAVLYRELQGNCVASARVVLILAFETGLMRRDAYAPSHSDEVPRQQSDISPQLTPIYLIPPSSL